MDSLVVRYYHNDKDKTDVQNVISHFQIRVQRRRPGSRAPTQSSACCVTRDGAVWKTHSPVVEGRALPGLVVAAAIQGITHCTWSDVSGEGAKTWAEKIAFFVGEGSLTEWGACMEAF